MSQELSRVRHKISLAFPLAWRGQELCSAFHMYIHAYTPPARICHIQAGSKGEMLAFVDYGWISTCHILMSPFNSA